MRAVAIGIAFAALATAAATCSFPRVEDSCTIVCGEQGRCPNYMVCGSGNYCYAGEHDPMCSGPADAGVEDAPVIVDAAPPPDADPNEADLQLVPTLFDFQHILVGGQTDAVEFEVTNHGVYSSGVLTASIATGNSSEFTIVSDGCSGTILNGAGQCTINAAFAPNAVGEMATELQVSATPGGVASTALSSTSLGLGLSPSAQDFGSVYTNWSSSGVTFTVQNPSFGNSGELTVALAGTDGNQFGFESDNCTGIYLGNGGSCQVTVFFAPTNTGDKNATLTITADPGGTASSDLTGTAVLNWLTIVPTSRQFGTVSVGSASVYLEVVVYNEGPSATGVLTAELVGADPDRFTIGTDECTGAPLANGGSCQVMVRYEPTEAVYHTAGIRISGAPGGVVQASLDGTGM